MATGKGIMTSERKQLNRKRDRRAAVEHTGDVKRTRIVGGQIIVEKIEVLAKDKFQDR